MSESVVGWMGWGGGMLRAVEGEGARVGEERWGNGALSKVPEVTLLFWIVKILATTLGETGGDALSMSLKLGYAVSTIILLVPFFVLVTFQIKAKRFHSGL